MSTPADTRTMGIVHGALRRDLARLRVVLGTPPYPHDRQRRAIAAHALWMMRFLHHHHEGEDAGLWPAVRARNPGAARLLDAMDADHRAIQPGIRDVQEAAERYGDDPTGRAALLHAVSALEETLLPHLRREELEMMPVVAATLTREEWDAIEQRMVAGVNRTELAAQGHWVIDNLDDSSRHVMLDVVPQPMRFVLLHVLGHRYRRQRRLLWGDGPAAAVPSLRVDAPDPTRP